MLAPPDGSNLTDKSEMAEILYIIVSKVLRTGGWTI